MSDYKLFVGIDISAKTAHIHWYCPLTQQHGKHQIPQNKLPEFNTVKNDLKVWFENLFSNNKK